jgi:hypothetical protein
MSRMAQLLTKAADALEAGEDPFGFNFLSENDVTSTECLDMADKIAFGARVMAWVTENPRDAAKFLEAGSAGMALNAITEALARHLGEMKGGPTDGSGTSDR